MRIWSSRKGELDEQLTWLEEEMAAVEGKIRREEWYIERAKKAMQRRTLYEMGLVKLQQRHKELSSEFERVGKREAI